MQRMYAAGYFGQFGKVTKVRVSRSKKTGRSKGYAFLQFQHAEVAAIAADAMNGYMMFGHTLRCHTIAPSDVHAQLFKHANRKMKAKPWRTIAAERHNRERTPDEAAAREAALVRRDARRQKRISELGLAYDYPALQKRKVAKKIKF